MSSNISNPHPKTNPQLILFGDSITQFSSLTLTARVSEWYSRRLDVLNRGFSGYTAPMGYEVLQEFFPTDSKPSATAPQVKLMTVFFGANDACVSGHPQHVPLDKYITGLKQIISYQALKAHSTKIILITPGPVDEWQLGNSDRNAENTRRYSRACRELGQELDLPILDLWTLFMLEAGWTEESTGHMPGSKDAPRNKVFGDLLNDGLHFTNQAYDLMFEELVKVIQDKLPDQTPESLPVVFPDWKEKLGIED